MAEGDRVVVAYRLRATHGGRRIDLPGVMRFVVEGERIARRVDLWDSLSFQQQAGLV